MQLECRTCSRTCGNDSFLLWDPHFVQTLFHVHFQTEILKNFYVRENQKKKKIEKKKFLFSDGEKKNFLHENKKKFEGSV